MSRQQRDRKRLSGDSLPTTSTPPPEKKREKKESKNT